MNRRDHPGIFPRGWFHSVPEDSIDMATSSDKVNNNAQGWGAAAATVVLALACVGIAYTVHSRTYHSPNDVLAPVEKTVER
ncbi:MAG: hypothetical protein HY275_01435 [Gemmatimonadetes bacterium]|nr:hypothetical protein [Gemmatimonadota bacterium]